MGALQPIVDESVPELMADFYRFLLSGMGVAEALARALRPAVSANRETTQWGSFLCVGQP